MSSKKIIAANWKMHLTYQEAKNLLTQLADYPFSDRTNIILALPFPYFLLAREILEQSPDNKNKIALAAQNCHTEAQGAYTGEISAPMLQSLHIPYTIIGHSERRMYHNENGTIVANKVKIALAHKIRPIFCIGEPLDIRTKNTHYAFISRQMEESILALAPELFEQLLLAYEPVWAIGTGKSASKEEAENMHLHIRNLIADKYGSHIAENITILYGGSVNKENAAGLFQQKNIDGALVGGASLQMETFLPIVQALQQE